jgi:hypothetical protein
MARLLPTLVALSVTSFSIHAIAQEHGEPLLERHGRYPDHDYWQHDSHPPDVVRLDSDSDRLAAIARHLHEDAHDLSQDYEHSEGIEGYVDQIDRLQQHLHHILHEAAESKTQSTELFEHVKSDVRQVKSWLNRLYMELQHQGFDGARTADYHAMLHMRRIIVNDAFPLVRQMESELYGHALFDDHWSTSHHRDLGARDLGARSRTSRRYRIRH